MKTYHKKRMRKLIAFLRQLPRRKFDFLQTVAESEANGHVCGTVCCAIGWTPAVFPRLVEWAPSLREDKHAGGRGIQLKGQEEIWFDELARELFGISNDTAHSLFGPNNQHEVGLLDLGDNATPKQVAAMLEKFLALVESGEVQA